jgi:hypothetical protein
MMGHRQRLVSGDEVDALTRRGKRVHRWRSGQRVAMKRKARSPVAVSAFIAGGPVNVLR